MRITDGNPQDSSPEVNVVVGDESANGAVRGWLRGYLGVS